MNAYNLFLLAINVYLAGGLLTLASYGNSKLAIRINGWFGVIASVLAFISSILVLTGQHFSLIMNGPFPFTEFVLEADALSGFFVLVISLIAAAASLYSISYLKEYEDKNPGLLGFITSIFIVSMLLVVTAGNAFYFLIFWEVMTLSSYFLVIYDRKQTSLKAGFLYFLVAHAGACLIMVAFFIFFAAAGNFDFSAFRAADLTPHLRTIIFVLALIGFAAKAGAVPLHFWLPGAHSSAPSHISALLSGVMIKTAVYGIIRVSFDLLGPGSLWWGVVVLALGAISAFLGISYALAQQDLKRLLAYSSVENIGLILMGVGLGLCGYALQQPVLAIVGLLSALYHIINHASFKGLLFLGAGSVLYSTHTRNMEKLGGLVHLMPVTAVLFFTGAMCISALPPLNGFVSEWFIYQSLLSLGLNGGFTGKLLAPLFAVLLAISGALTAMCFVKAYGITFTGPCRSKEVEHSREVPLSMLAGKALLALSCLLLGIGAPLITPRLAAVSSSIVGGAVSVNAGLSIFPGSTAQGIFSPPLTALLILGTLLLPVLLVISRSSHLPSRVDLSPWACGYSYSSEMACNSRSFAQPLQIILRPIYQARTLRREKKGYFAVRVGHLTQYDDIWKRCFGSPLVRAIQSISKGLQLLHLGNVRLYCSYIILVLVVLLTLISL